MNIIDRSKKRLDLLIFPEGFENVRPTEHSIPENIYDNPQVKTLINRYYSYCVKYKISIIVGFQLSYGGRKVNGGDSDQYCFIVKPDESAYIYHKHSTSRSNAFFDAPWSIDKNFIVSKVGCRNIGISICHDSYISLIPRLLKQKGTDIWVNISYQNVESNKWQAIHYSRAFENNFISICTLHRNSCGRKNRQREPYAFSKEGKINLVDLEIGREIERIDFDNRAGLIYVFDAQNYYITSIEKPKETGLGIKAKRLSIEIPSDGDIISTDSNTFIFRCIDIKSFIYRPERLWSICLEEKGKTVLFFTSLKDQPEWDQWQDKILNIIKARIIEFSTLFLFKTDQNDPLIVAYRSSNYKDCRLFYPNGFPFAIDEQYLKGLDSTYKISLGDYRNRNDDIYFAKVQKMIDFINKDN